MEHKAETNKEFIQNYFILMMGRIKVLMKMGYIKTNDINDLNVRYEELMSNAIDGMLECDKENLAEYIQSSPLELKFKEKFHDYYKGE